MVISAEGSSGLGRAERAGALGSAVSVRGYMTGRHGGGGSGSLWFAVERLKFCPLVSMARRVQLLAHGMRANIQCG